jgi:hypothetical protein
MKIALLIFLAIHVLSHYAHGDGRNGDLSNHLQSNVKPEADRFKKESSKKRIRVYFSGPSGSFHWDREAEANEENWVRGLGMPFNDTGMVWIIEIEAFALHYTNSEGNPSNALGFNLILRCNDNQVKMCWGFGLGGVDGYAHNQGRFEIINYPIPHLSFNYKSFRFNFYFNHIAAMYSPGWEWQTEY